MYHGGAVYVKGKLQVIMSFICIILLTYDAGWGRADSTRVGQQHTGLASRSVMQGEAG